MALHVQPSLPPIAKLWVDWVTGNKVILQSDLVYPCIATAKELGKGKAMGKREPVSETFDKSSKLAVEQA